MSAPRPRALAAFVVLAVAIGGCAGGGDDPGVAPDRCKTRDCGPSSGGPESDPLDSDEEFDTDLPPPEDTAFEDTHEPGLDTAADGADVGRLDAAADTTTSDSAVPDSGIDTGIDSGPTCTVPTGKACGWSPQCGCTAGQNCDFTATDGSVACVAAGAVDRNGKCTALGQCKKGLTCTYGLCVPFCTVVADCPAAGSPLCHGVSGGTTDIPGLLVCMQQCDPRAPAAVCGAATACDIVDGAAGTTTCSKSGTSTALGGCATDVYACAPGYTCVGTAGDCLSWCRVGFPGDCSGGRTCFSFSDHPKIKAVEYGVCDF